MPEYWANDLIQDDALKLPVELKLHLTGIILKGDKVPLPRKVLEWAIHKDHINAFGATIGVSGMKILINALKVDIDFGIQNSLGLLKNFHSTAPRQELWVARNISYQTIHTVRGLAN